MPAGPTVVAQLKIELGVPATDTLFEIHPDPAGRWVTKRSCT